MFKIIIFSISCVLFVSGCAKQKSRTQSHAQPVAAPKSIPDVVLQTKKEESAKVPQIKTDTTLTPAVISSPAPAPSPTASPSPVSTIPTITTPQAPESPVATKPATVMTTPELTKAPATPPEASKKEIKTAEPNKSDENLAQLTYEETRNLDMTLASQMSEDSLQALVTPLVSKNFSAQNLNIKFEGTYEKPLYALLHKDEKVVEFKNFSFSLSKQTKIKVDNYNLLGICIGAQCEVLFLDIFRLENGKLAENYPAILKWVNNKYVPAQRMDTKEYTERLKKEKTENPGLLANQNPAEKISKAPPQLRVKLLLGTNTQKYFTSMVEALDVRMKRDNSIYSARLFVNVKPGSFDWILTQAKKDELNLALKIDFTESEKRAPIEFKGIMGAKASQLKDKGGMTLDVIPKIPNEFYLMIFENDQFESPLANSKKAIQAHVCQILVEGLETYNECEHLSSTYVLGAWAQEGRIGGPILLNVGADGKPIITEKYKPMSLEELQKQIEKQFYIRAALLNFNLMRAPCSEFSK